MLPLKSLKDLKTRRMAGGEIDIRAVYLPE
jgi:hypothetical protein